MGLDAEPALFYSQLVAVLQTLNEGLPRSEQISLRRATVEGLGLRDSFVSKIKDGTYKPTLERLKRLTELLGIPPTTFDLYVQRWGHDQIENDPEILEILTLLAGQSESTQTILKVGINRLVRRLLKAATVESESIPA